MKHPAWPLLASILAACGETGPGGAGTVGGVGLPAPGAQPALNDTGVTVYITDANDGNAPLVSTIAPADWPNQDAAFGRDALAGDDSDGRAGFRFSKLDGDGRPLPADAPTWDCVRDEVTGLIWEVKTDDPNDPRYGGHTFSWYDPDPTRNGGHPGKRDEGNCNGETTGLSCDTAAYIRYVNDIGLCGFRDWRLPTVPELLSLVDFGAADIPLIDTRFFPNTFPSDHWSSQTAVGRACTDYLDAQKRQYEGGNAWEVHFDLGHAETHCKWDNRGTGQVAIHVRLVRG